MPGVFFGQEQAKGQWARCGAFSSVAGTGRLARRRISHRAKVAELVDALDLGSSAARRGGSSPPFRTRPRSTCGLLEARASPSEGEIAPAKAWPCPGKAPSALRRVVRFRIRPRSRRGSSAARRGGSSPPFRTRPRSTCGPLEATASPSEPRSLACVLFAIPQRPAPPCALSHPSRPRRG